MIYLDNAATSFYKPPVVKRAMLDAMQRCANPGRGGYREAMAAAETVYSCRETAGALFGCSPEQVVFTSNCTHGLNIAISTLVRPGSCVLISGFEHNAVTRPLHALGADIVTAGDRLFDWENTLEQFEKGLRSGVEAAIFTHVSNVFGYILPVDEMADLCRKYHVPFAVDAAQSAGSLPVSLSAWGADFVAMPGHKGLLGPQGTGLLLCARLSKPLLYGGTGSLSIQQEMPDFLPDRAEAGTLNVPGIAGLDAGMRYVRRLGLPTIFRRERRQTLRCIAGLEQLGYRVFSGAHQAAVVSFVPAIDCQQMADFLSQQHIAVRGGLHCAPLAHQTAGTLDTGTVRISFGHQSEDRHTDLLLQKIRQIP